MKLFTASLATESNTFSPVPTSAENFYEAFYAAPGEHPDRPMPCTEPLWVARRRAVEDNFELVEGTCAWSEPSGTCARAAYEGFRDEILAQLKAALPLDGVLLGLHGAMVADGYDDCEGDLIARVREIVGKDVVIGVEHDPHCHLTKKRLEGADILVTYKEFPHTDTLERAEEVVDLTLRAIRGEIRPVMSAVDGRTIASFPTSREPMRSFVDRISAMEGKDGILSISIAHGFPFGDVPEIGLRVLVITDDRKEQGDRLARELTDELVAMRGKSTPEWLAPDLAIDRALASTAEKPVIITDPTDNPGGGAPGDSTRILRRLIEREVDRVAFGPLWDPIAVRFCFAVDVGGRLNLRIGGKTGPESGDPLDVRAEVTGLARNATQSFSGGKRPTGDCAAIKVGGIEIVLVTKRAQAMGLELFSNVGVDLPSKRIISLKSTNHFYAAYAPLAAEVLYCEGGGSQPRDVRQVPYTKVQRPIWPLDEVAEPVHLL